MKSGGSQIKHLNACDTRNLVVFDTVQFYSPKSELEMLQKYKLCPRLRVRELRRWERVLSLNDFAE